VKRWCDGGAVWQRKLHVARALEWRGAVRSGGGARIL
jgi:hypothetical protein